ncbi:MAG: carboxypeptidase regulatory-like domain-containing protein [Planctomycetaceae bacterium]|nr:carboxypeptidase regulatory-like domain-containing protein [Planctomycetaceae bacterium]
MSRNLLCSFIGLALLTGCGGAPSDMPPLGTVTGTVTVDGQPLANAMVTFTPAEGGRPSTGMTGPDGAYALKYTADHMGAAIGKHFVTVGKLQAEGSYESGKEAEQKDDAPSGLPAAAGDRSITKDVAAGDNKVDISL